MKSFVGTAFVLSVALILCGIESTAAAQPKLEELADNPPLFLQAARKLLKWDDAAEPAHIVGPIYFVGTKGLSVYLITGPEGHVVINTGMPGSGPLIEASIRQLGFEPKDVKLILAGHAHVDHVGGHAPLQKATGAKIALIREEQKLFESGGKLDFHYGKYKEFLFDPAKVDQVFRDEDEIQLGDIAIQALLTNGHTQGSTTFVMKVADEGKEYSVVFPNGTSVNPGYRVAKNPSYPGIGDDFRRTLRILESLTPDIWLMAHTEAFGYEDKLARSAQEGTKAWVDPDGYRAWVKTQREKFEAAVKREGGE